MSDPGWLQAWEALRPMHEEKSSTYGTQDDALWNFVLLGIAKDKPAEEYALERIVEKGTRALNMIRAGLADQVAEYPDMSSLALCCEALRQRRVK